jgi:hypothetical protein
MRAHSCRVTADPVYLPDEFNGWLEGSLDNFKQLARPGLWGGKYGGYGGAYGEKV